MENYKDIQSIADQLDALKKNIDKSKEHLSALEMLMVDNNNGRLKSEGLGDELQELNNSIDSLTRNVQALERKLNH
ncbi:DNA replication initiation control protein YabA [Natronincola ferrireducens]|uniref:Uncharacterized protein n=1 Tax=Natronincola ferrireducens TaxID=393762 RepID=A0A1G9I842_9FIRM|nr:DNA replication initiation control protein YabA [Natronincola ferrireducens]SDL21398.1 hypothetical protein SAMN05660472_02825 [Natronincola ferrireducens]